MKTTEQTDNTHEQPIHELKRSRWDKIGAYFFAFVLLFAGSLVTWVTLIISFLGGLYLVRTFGDIYFYEGYVERRCIFPFMKPDIIYYEEMSAHFDVMDSVYLSHYETWPKFWKSPYTWLKAKSYDSILIGYYSRYYTPEILEFIKTKARSVSYHE